MAKESRIKFNPLTKEIEVEGTEKFVRIYFSKLQQMMSGDGEEAPKGARGRKTAQKKTVAKKETKAPAKKKAKVQRKPKAKKEAKAIAKKVSGISKIVDLIQKSEAGISTKELQKKTGLKSRQIWTSIYRALKAGKIQKAKRGLYVKA
jgi:hypothetical protein